MAISKTINDLATKIAKEEGFDPKIVLSVITQESGGNPFAKNKDSGASGLMQLMTDITRQYNVTDPFDPEQNIRAGTKYLKALEKEYGNLPEALAHYNGGGDAVKFFRNKGGIFTDSTKDIKAWSNQTGNYVKHILGRAGYDTSKIPEAKQDQVVALRNQGKIPKITPDDIMRGPNLIADLSDQKKNPDNPLGFETIAMSNPGFLQGGIGKSEIGGVQVDTPQIQLPDFSKLIFQPAKAEELSPYEEGIRSVDAAFSSEGAVEPAKSQESIPSPPQMSQELSSSNSIQQDLPQPDRTPLTPIAPLTLQNIGKGILKPPAGVYNLGASIINEALPTNDPLTSRLPLGDIQEFTPTGKSSEELEKERPFASFATDIGGGIAEFAPSTVTGGAVTKTLIQKKLQEQAAKKALTSGLGVVGGPLLAGISAAATVQGLIELGSLAGKQAKEEVKARERTLEKVDTLPTGNDFVDQRSTEFKPAGGLTNLGNVNKAQVATAAALALGGEVTPFLGPALKAGKVGFNLLKSPGSTLGGIAQAPKTILDSFFGELESKALSEVEKQSMYKFVAEFNNKINEGATVGTLRQSNKAVIKQEKYLLGDALESIQPARSFTKEQSLELTKAKQSFKKAVEEYNRNLEFNRQATPELLESLNNEVLAKQQELVYTASKFGIGKETIRNAKAQIRLSTQKIQALTNLNNKLKNFSPDEAIENALFVFTGEQIRLTGKGIVRGKVSKENKEKLFTESKDKGAGYLMNKAGELASKVKSLYNIESRIRNLQFALEEAMAKDIPIGRTRDEYNVIMNDLVKVAAELGYKYESLGLKDIEKIKRELLRLEEKATKKGIQIESQENVLQAAIEEMGELSETYQKKENQVFSPEKFSINTRETLRAQKDFLNDKRTNETITGGIEKVRRTLANQLVETYDLLNYLESIGTPNVSQVRKALISFEDRMTDGAHFKADFDLVLEKANLKPRTKASKLLAIIQQNIGTDEILKVNTEDPKLFAKTYGEFTEKFKGKVELSEVFNNPALKNEMTMERFRALQIVVQRNNPFLARYSGFDRFGIKDPYFFSQAGTEKFATISEEVFSRLLDAFKIKNRTGLTTDVVKSYTMKNTGAISQDELINDFVISNMGRIDAAFYKESVESLFEVFEHMLRSGQINEDLAAPVFSAVAQLTATPKNFGVLGRTFSNIANVTSGAMLNSYKFLVQDLYQGINSLVRIGAENPQAITLAARAILNPKEQRELILGLSNLGVYSGDPGRKLLNQYALGEASPINGAFQGSLNELGQSLNKGIDDVANLFGGIAVQDPRVISQRAKTLTKFLGNNPFINGAETILRTLTGTLAIFDKYGDDTLNVLRVVNKRAEQTNKFIRQGSGVGSLKESVAKAPSSPIGKTVTDKLDSVVRDAKATVFKAIRKDLFVESQFSSLFSKRSSMLRMSHYGIRQAAFMLDLLRQNPKAFALYVQATLALGGPETLFPYIANINAVSSRLGLGKVVNETDFQEAQNAINNREIKGAAILSLFNQGLDQGLSRSTTPDILGLFPPQVGLLEFGLNTEKKLQNSEETGGTFTENALDILPWAAVITEGLTGAKTHLGFSSAKALKFGVGNPFADKISKRSPRKDLVYTPVASTNGTHIEELPLNDMGLRASVLFGVGKKQQAIKRLVASMGDVKNLIRAEVGSIDKLARAVSEGVDNPIPLEIEKANYARLRERRFLQQEDSIRVFGEALAEDRDLFRFRLENEFSEFEKSQFEVQSEELSKNIKEYVAELDITSSRTQRENIEKRLEADAQRLIILKILRDPEVDISNVTADAIQRGVDKIIQGVGF